MKLSDRIKATFANYRFRKEMIKANQQREVVNFNEAGKIGLLYDATDDNNFEAIKQYVKNIRSEKKEVTALGYIDKKTLPPTRFPQLGLDFFTKKDFNWKMKPRSLSVSNFMNENFDIVVNLNRNNIFPLSYIAAVSKAKFRVGSFNRHFVHCYDMMIETKNDTDIKDFIQQADNYLRKVKASK